jgi:hypothetical protein
LRGCFGGEFTEEFAGGGVDDADVQVQGEQQVRGWRAGGFDVL